MAIDCHVHMVLDGVEWKNAIARHKDKPDEGYIRSVLAIYREKGYIYLRDGGDRWGAGAAAKKMAPEYGISYRTPLAPLCARGCYGEFIGQAYDSIKDYARMVRQHRKNGADFIKIMISGLMDFDRFGVLTQEGLPADRIRELIHIAHEEGFAVMAHVNGARTVEAAACAGVDSVEHGAYLDEAALHAMKEANVVWVPTLSTIGNLRGKDRFDRRAVQQILENAMERVCNFAQMGGLLAVGTDAGAWSVPHGCCTEVALLAQAGVDTEILNRGADVIMRKF